MTPTTDHSRVDNGHQDQYYNPFLLFSSVSILFSVLKNLCVAIIGPKHRHPSMFHQNICFQEVCYSVRTKGPIFTPLEAKTGP